MVEFRPVELAALRLEYRHDWSSESVFAGRSGPNERDEQDTLAFEIRVQF